MTMTRALEIAIEACSDPTRYAPEAAALLERAKPWILAAETTLVFYHPGDTAVSAGNLAKVYEAFRAAQERAE